MTFRDREKKRLEPLKSQLFSEDACASGMYRGKRRSFCLHEAHAPENIHLGVRDAALEYFDERGIGWHDGKGKGPSNHLCCSQSCCVNFWFPFVRAPLELAAVLRGLGYDVAEMLPVETDCALADGTRPFVAFEWIRAELPGGTESWEGGSRPGPNTSGGFHEPGLPGQVPPYRRERPDRRRRVEVHGALPPGREPAN